MRHPLPSLRPAPSHLFPAAPPQPLARCAPEGAGAPREARPRCRRKKTVCFSYPLRCLPPSVCCHTTSLLGTRGRQGTARQRPSAACPTGGQEVVARCAAHVRPTDQTLPLQEEARRAAGVRTAAVPPTGPLAAVLHAPRCPPYGPAPSGATTYRPASRRV